MTRLTGVYSTSACLIVPLIDLPAMPFCTKCGGVMDQGDRFCRECGEKVRTRSVRSPTAMQAPASSDSSSPFTESMNVSASKQGPATAPATFLGPSGAQNPLSFASAEAKEPLNRRPLFVLGAMLLIAFTGWSVYRLSSPTISVARPIAVEGTGEPSDTSADASGAQPRQGPDSRRLWNVVADSTGGVADAANALDAPDGRVATIARGGTLALASTQGPFYSGDGASIRVHGPQGQRMPYAIFARTGPERPWRQVGVNRNGLPEGVAVHDFGRQAIENAQQILLRNDGASPLYIDAVAPMYRR